MPVDSTWIVYQCTHCRKLLYAEDGNAGRRCPLCDTGWLSALGNEAEHERAEGMR